MSVTRRGFTLIELLVVVAIIGLLSSVILSSLGAARIKGRIAAAQSAMHNIQTAMVTCLGDASAISTPSMTNTGGGGAVCPSNAAVYTALPVSWMYCDASAGTAAGGDSITAGSLACNNNTLVPTPSFSTVTGISFRVSAYSSADKKMITCQENGCTAQTAL